MQNTHLRHQLYLRGPKTLILLIVLVGISFSTYAQRGAGKERRVFKKEENLPNYDNRWLHYGFSIGLHSSSYRVKYSDLFTSDAFDSLHSVTPGNSFGFSLGLIASFRVADYLDVQLMPEIVFYEHQVDYNYVNRGNVSLDRQSLESTYVEFPLLFKYKSVRRGNNRVYLIGGVEGGIEATGKKNREESEDRLPITDMNLSVLVGFGLDAYFPLFKFAPELRYSRGINNVLAEKSNRFSQPLSRISTHTITLYFLFQ